MEELMGKVATDLVNPKYAIALTGAGISTESGIPVFRLLTLTQAIEMISFSLPNSRLPPELMCYTYADRAESACHELGRMR